MAEVQTAPHFLRDTFLPDLPDATPEDSITTTQASSLLPLEVTSQEETAHEPPSFDESHGEEEVLYLPPLLSSLPQSLSSQIEPKEGTKDVPLHTSTHLPSIDPVSLSLHKALHKFKPFDTQYASRPYGEAFNWANLVLPIEEEREWYCVAFRSRRKAGSESAPLYEQDRLAHEEAVHRGGLIMYWYGVPDPKTGLNLATCVWQSRKFALAAMTGPQHVLAMRLAAASFAEFRLERYILRKEVGETGLRVYPYVSGEVGW
ncbi:hypothetical protein FRC14_001107 [Serendipita sp. 396]|nr:hypothetical protein FRC14_001107 [Serendipita sp. 396]KAG8850501.1 hypothetical protein FRC20_001999 [Serendipita sp. 405]